MSDKGKSESKLVNNASSTPKVQKVTKEDEPKASTDSKQDAPKK